MKLHVKYMVSQRCKMIVEDALKTLGLNFVMVELGEIEIMGNVSDVQREKLRSMLLESGLDLMDDKRTILIEKIKHLVINLVHYTDDLPSINYSDFISQKLNYNYIYLSNLFSEVKRITIQQFIIHHKIERIKELIIYGELTMSEIAWKMNYSSVAHLSNQFKKITGISPTHYKQLKEKRRLPIEDIGR